MHTNPEFFDTLEKMHPIAKLIESDTEDNRLLNSLFVLPSKLPRKFVEIGDEKVIMPLPFVENWPKVKNLEVRDDDVFIVGHPKSGTNWAHEITLHILNLNETKNSIHLDKFLIYDLELIKEYVPEFSNWKDLSSWESPRIIRTHLPWFLLPEQIQNESKTPKIIHVLRNPKDVCISWFHFSKLMLGYKGTFYEFYKLFLAGKLTYGPYFANVKSFWEKKNYPNVFWLKYSDLIKDPSNTIGRMATFLNKPLSKIEIEFIVKETSKGRIKNCESFKMIDRFVENMAQACDAGVEKPVFLRKGIEGSYKSEMTEEQQEEFDRVAKEKFDKLDITF